MTGKENGVAGKFKKLLQREIMLNMHCICHRLTSACADARDDLHFIKDFEITMIQLWAFFKNPPKRLKIYITTAMKIKEFENLPKDKERKVIRTVIRAVRTRWLSLEAAVDGVFKEYSHLIQALRELQ